MKIVFRSTDCTECWDGVFYKKLSNYPNITDWEIQTIIDFITYEKNNGRNCILEGEATIVTKVNNALRNPKLVRISVPPKIEECTACPKYKGCMTDLVCHTSSIKNGIQILKCRSLLSPVKARKVSAEAKHLYSHRI